MPDIAPPTDQETLTEYLARFATDDERALAVREFRSATKGVKVLNEETGLLGGWGIPFGGPVLDKEHPAGKDLDGEYFDETTNFCFDWFPNEGRPVLYDHGTDPEIKLATVGRQVSKFVDPQKGVWVETQLNMANQYAKYILELAKKGVLSFSSGALAGYVRRAASGKIEQWPYIEQTYTVRPANPYAAIPADAVKHLKAVDALPPELASLVPDEQEPLPSLTDALKAGLEAKSQTTKKLTLPDGMSFGDLRSALEDALKDRAPDAGYMYAVDIRDNKVIGCVGDDYFQYDFAIAANGDVTVDYATMVEVNQSVSWVLDADEGKSLLAVAEHLEQHGWSNKAGRTMSARNLGQLHQSVKAMQDLHASTCDMGTDCPMYDASSSKQAKPPDDPAREAERQEIDEYLATIELPRGGSR